MQLLRNWPVRLEWRWQFASPTHSMTWTSELTSPRTTSAFKPAVKWVSIRPLTLSVPPQDHRVEWRSVPSHLQAVPDPHQSYGCSGGARGVRHGGCHGEMHYAAVRRPWWQVWGPLLGGAGWVSTSVTPQEQFRFKQSMKTWSRPHPKLKFNIRGWILMFFYCDPCRFWYRGAVLSCVAGGRDRSPHTTWEAFGEEGQSN